MKIALHPTWLPSETQGIIYSTWGIITKNFKLSKQGLFKNSNYQDF